jgi:hypothetical protein
MHLRGRILKIPVLIAKLLNLLKLCVDGLREGA